MIRRIRDTRVSYRTGFIIIALALVLWGVMTWVRIRDLVPDEMEQPAEAPDP